MASAHRIERAEIRSENCRIAPKSMFSSPCGSQRGRSSWFRTGSCGKHRFVPGQTDGTPWPLPQLACRILHRSRKSLHINPRSRCETAPPRIFCWKRLAGLRYGRSAGTSCRTSTGGFRWWLPPQSNRLAEDAIRQRHRGWHQLAIPMEPRASAMPAVRHGSEVAPTIERSCQWTKILAANRTERNHHHEHAGRSPHRPQGPAS